jgi:putative RecB family exonuclease
MNLSHSQIELWNQCQYRWFLTKIKRVPQAPSPDLIVGLALHAALEADGRCFIESANDQRIIASTNVTLVALDALDQELEKQDTEHELPRDSMQKRVRAMSIAYALQVAPKYRPSEVEVPFTVPISESTAFTGRIDGITPRAIVDFKTANTMAKWREADLTKKDQATAYIMARPEMNQVTFIVLAYHPDMSDQCEVACLPTSRTRHDVIRYQQTIKAVAAEMEARKQVGDFPENTGLLCGWCGVLGHCSAGQRWLADHHREPAVPIRREQ